MGPAGAAAGASSTSGDAVAGGGGAGALGSAATGAGAAGAAGAASGRLSAEYTIDVLGIELSLASNTLIKISSSVTDEDIAKMRYRLARNVTI